MPDQPKQLGAAPKDPVIYTIPDQFYGLAAKAQLPKETMAAAAPAVPGAPVAPAAAPAVMPPPPAEKGSKAWILIPIVAVLLLGGIGFGIWMLIKPKPPAAPTTPSVTLPTPQPEPEPEPQPEPEPATTTEEVPPPPSPSADGDGDGLTTSEEALFGTNLGLQDTDGDGFTDSVEVVNLYNPAGFRPTKLIEAGLVLEFSAAAGPFTALYPASWAATGTNLPTADMLMVAVPNDSSAEGERFVVRDGGALGDQTLLDAYLTRNPGASPSQVQPFTTKSGLEGVRSPDGATAYIAVDGQILIVNHERVNQALFASTFTMFLNSFSKKP